MHPAEPIPALLNAKIWHRFCRQFGPIYWNREIGGFGARWHSRSGPIGPILYSFVPLIRGTKLWSMGPIGPLLLCQRAPKQPISRRQPRDGVFSNPGSSRKSWNDYKFDRFDRPLTFFRWVWRKKFHVDFSFPIHGKQKWKKNSCRYQSIYRVRAHLKGDWNAFLRLAKNTQKT